MTFKRHLFLQTKEGDITTNLNM